MGAHQHLLASTSAIVFSLTLAISPASAQGQEAEAATSTEIGTSDVESAPVAAPLQPDSAALEEIVVTARKRSESLQDVPISVVAISGELMHQQGVKKLEDLQYKVPNFSMTEAGIGTNIAIRGISSGVNQGFEQSVGIYVDGIHYGRAQQSRAPFLDVERVEVLRGPQSILFGKNAIAGALNIISAQPTDELEGYVQGSFEPKYNDYEVAGAVSGAIADGVRVRIAGRYHDADGYIENLTLDRSEPKRNDWNLRATFAVDVTDNLEVTLKAEHGTFDVDGRNIEVYKERPSIHPSPAFNGKTYAEILQFIGGLSPADLVVVDPSVANNVKDGKRSANDAFSDNKSNNLVLTANWDTNFGTVTSISGLSNFKYDELCDCDHTGAVVFNAGIQEDYQQFSQELRLVSDAGGKVDYIVGTFFQSSDHDYSDQINVPTESVLVPVVNLQAPGNGAFLAGTSASREAHADNKLWSAFGQLTYNFTNQARVQLGARLTREKKDGDRTITIENLDGTALTGTKAIVAPLLYGNLFKISSTNLTDIAGMPIPQAAVAKALLASLGAHPVDAKVSKTSFLPSVNLQYDVNPDVMLYGSWVVGAKSGGFDFRGNNRGFYANMADAFEFGEERANTFELGSKTKFLDGRAMLNLALYYTKMKDLQVSVFDGTLGFVVGNADARTMGLEADGRLKITRDLTLRGSLALTDFKFTNYPNGQCYPGQAPDGLQGQCDYDGKTNQLVSDWQGTIALDYATPISDNLEIRGTVDLFATVEYYTAPTLDPDQKQDTFGKINARLALGDLGNRWEVAILARNLTDKKISPFGAQTPLAYATFGAYSQANVVTEGRTFTLQGRFGF